MDISTKREVTHTITMSDKEARDIMTTLQSLTYDLNDGTNRLYGLLANRNNW